MSNLIKKELTLDSREVAKMVGKEHKELLRDIRKYQEYLGESNLALTDFFIPNTYVSEQNKELPKVDCTKKGCELIAHKLTGQKGTLFSATYINRFHEMEKELVDNHKKPIIDELKAKEIEAKLNNSRARQAKLLTDMAKDIDIPEYKQILNSKATEIISGQALLPLPEAEETTYTAKEIGEILGISGNMVGRLTNKHELKTSEFGKYFYDKAKHSSKQVESFRYYNRIVPVLRGLLDEDE